MPQEPHLHHFNRNHFNCTIFTMPVYHSFFCRYNTWSCFFINFFISFLKFLIDFHFFLIFKQKSDSRHTQTGIPILLSLNYKHDISYAKAKLPREPHAQIHLCLYYTTTYCGCQDCLYNILRDLIIILIPFQSLFKSFISIFFGMT